jgi:hypothetical protein
MSHLPKTAGPDSTKPRFRGSVFELVGRGNLNQNSKQLFFIYKFWLIFSVEYHYVPGVVAACFI